VGEAAALLSMRGGARAARGADAPLALPAQGYRFAGLRLRRPSPGIDMPSNLILHEVTQNEIRWCVTRRLDLPEPGCITYLPTLS
jgi:hypothetical protein